MPFKNNQNDTINLANAIAAGFNFYFNYTGNVSCLEFTTGLDNQSNTVWDFQSCTEMVFPYCSNGILDMFFPTQWNLTANNEMCFSQYNVTPRINWEAYHYGEKSRQLKSHSNIVFSNGGIY